MRARVCLRSGCTANRSACGFLLRTACGCRPPNPFFPQDHYGVTALIFAAEKGSLEVCQFLVANKAEVNAKA